MTRLLEPTEKYLTRALELYDDLDVLLTDALEAEPEQRLRLAGKVFGLCHELDLALDRARVAPMGDTGRR